ncbi:EAL domain-containing protein [Escherichia coli]
MTSAPGTARFCSLERFTLDYLKIDRGFRRHRYGNNHFPVLDAVLTLAKRLNMLTVAEGVETRNRRDG